MSMTYGDMQELSRIIGGKALTPETLARELLRHYRMHKAGLERYAAAVQQRNDLRKEVRSTKEKHRLSPTNRQLRAENERLNELLRISYQRNEILSEKLKGAAA